MLFAPRFWAGTVDSAGAGVYIRVAFTAPGPGFVESSPRLK